ncbi:MAG: protein kinase [bacterium]|nr:protein kinase [bacterium]
MICTNCQTPNHADNRFCCDCGKPLKAAVTAVSVVNHGTQPAAGVSSSGLLSPSTLLQDRYRITQLVGQGGMGAVYLANDTRFSSKVCVVKEMLDHFTDAAQRESAMQNFYREADLLANLKHNSIPEVFDRFTESNRHYIVMEYIQGMDLEARMHEANNQPFEEANVIGWAIQVCDVLSYLHHQKPPIIFRDMKPANLMLTDFGKIYLVDFGIARFFNPQARGTMIGTQGYAPPEQYRGQVEPRTDIYALGATMHYMLTGRDPQNEPPFSFPPIRQMNEKVSPELEAIVTRALESDLEKRFPSADEMLIDLIRVAGETSSAVRSCPHCREKISRGRQFCPHCRNYIAAHHTSTSAQIYRAATSSLNELSGTGRKPPKLDRAWWIAAAVVGALAIIALGVWFAGAPVGRTGVPATQTMPRGGQP